MLFILKLNSFCPLKVSGNNTPMDTSSQASSSDMTLNDEVETEVAEEAIEESRAGFISEEEDTLEVPTILRKMETLSNRKEDLETAELARR